MSINIAIDGPAGAGKSTIAKKIAKLRGFIYVDTGAMFRTLALYLIRNNADFNDSDKISELCNSADIKIRYEDGEQQLYLNNENVSSLLRSEEVGNMASACGKNPDVRNKLKLIQQEMAKETDLVMDGRDIGTAVLPDATVKIFLTASVDVRAKRRYDELLAKNQPCDLEKIKADIEARDYQDTHRQHAPLKQASDAILVDSSYMSIDEVVNKINDIIGDKLNG